MSGREFKLGARVTAQLGNPTLGAWFQVLQEQIVMSNMRVQFEIEKSLAKQPNRAKIIISNLNEATRQSIQSRKPLKVTLEVGFDGQLDVLFRGDATLVESTHDRTDWLTRLESGDGDRAFANARVSQSFAPGVTGKQLIAAVASSMGLSVPKNVADAKALVSQIAGGGGVSLHGMSADEMSRHLGPTGLQWSIQDEQLQALGPGDVTDEDAMIVSQKTGMIGVPNYDLPKTPGKPAILKVKMEVNTAAKPGRRILMQSQAIQGLFRIERVTHRGDTHSTTTAETEVFAKLL